MSWHKLEVPQCPLYRRCWGDKRTSRGESISVAIDPKATSPRLKALRTRPKRRMKMANAPALIGHRDQHGEARWRLDDASILGL